MVKVRLLDSVVFVGSLFFFFFFSSRRRHTRSCLVSWARRCVQETGSFRSGNRSQQRLPDVFHQSTMERGAFMTRTSFALIQALFSAGCIFAGTAGDATPAGSTVVQIDGVTFTTADLDARKPTLLFQARNAFYDPCTLR
eukprot:TRINITY_DN23319_c0_g1_i2.p1 TRINITY_DN23319_c0_g1~~TRINITY_DN23319_c0_g1_i2.p1  ORF type:complete len:140 (+),score=6.17 TRINITY_DN23319_c0_g1_i2:11-430(+)